MVTSQCGIDALPDSVLVYVGSCKSEITLKNRCEIVRTTCSPKVTASHKREFVFVTVTGLVGIYLFLLVMVVYIN